MTDFHGKIERLVFKADGVELIVGPSGGLHISAGPRFPYEKVVRVSEQKGKDYTCFVVDFEADWRRAIALETDKATELREWLTQHKIKIEA